MQWIYSWNDTFFQQQSKVIFKNKNWNTHISLAVTIIIIMLVILYIFSAYSVDPWKHGG